MKPVAWWSQGQHWEFISGAEQPPIDTFGESVPLYTADQLRAAQIAVLRDAAVRCNALELVHEIFAMADELESAK